MSEQDKAMMEKYGITCETQITYRYKEHRYENLNDALNFAKIDSNLPHENNVSTPKKK